MISDKKNGEKSSFHVLTIDDKKKRTKEKRKLGFQLPMLLISANFHPS